MLRTLLTSNNSTLHKLSSLERTASAHASDTLLQATFYALCNRYGYYNVVISRYNQMDRRKRPYFKRSGETEKEYEYAKMREFSIQDDTLLTDFMERGNNSGEEKTVKVVHYVNASEDENFYKYIKGGVGFVLLFGLIYYASDEIRYYIARNLNSSLPKTSVNLNKPVTSNTKFEQVKGCNEAKLELQETVEFLKDPSKFNTLGGNISRGILLIGPPGTGKTLLAKAVAGESGVPFYYASGSEFDEMLVGVGAKRIKLLFEAAKKHKGPVVIFIDEIDAIASKRNHETSRNYQTINQLLTEMDGFSSKENVIVIAATNIADSLDPAAVRAGRFDKHVHVSLPDIGGRKDILDLYLNKVKIGTDVNSLVLAKGTPGCSGADLYNIVNSAAIKASAEQKPFIAMKDLEFAKDKILMGTERKSALISVESRKKTAFHEGGHALVATLTPHANPIHMATIIPRGNALGLVYQLPKDETSITKAELLARIDVCMGGRGAEELIFGAENVSIGASNDLQQATKLATEMVLRWGMSSKIGSVYKSKDDLKYMSSEMQQNVDREINLILNDSMSRVRVLLNHNRNKLDNIANALIEHESLNGDEVNDVISGKKLITIEQKIMDNKKI